MNIHLRKFSYFYLVDTSDLFLFCANIRFIPLHSLLCIIKFRKKYLKEPQNTILRSLSTWGVGLFCLNLFSKPKTPK